MTSKLTQESVARIPSDVQKRRNSTSSVASSAQETDNNSLPGYGTGLNKDSSQDSLSRPSTSGSTTSESTTNTSRSGSSTQRSSIGEPANANAEVHDIDPLPYPRADTVFREIQNRMQSINQEYIEKLKDDMFNVIESKKMNNLPNYYLFVVKDNKILCIFETEAEFKLETTNKYENTELLPKNYITSDRYKFNSVSQIKSDNDLKPENIPGSQSNYTGLGSYAPYIPGKIEFYIYDANSDLKKTYFTHGSIFIYGEGIASTCEIIELNANDTTSMIKKDVLAHGVPKIKFEQLSAKYDHLITEIKSYVFGSDNQGSALNMNKVYIHFLNAISPDDLKSVLNNDATKIKAVVKILYVNISCPPDKSPDKYNLLHKYINYYYAYKTRSLSKIEKYIGPNEYSQFVMHIFDFFEFLMFLKNKDDLINCCIDIYNSYKGNYDSGFNTLGVTDALIVNIQKKIQEKQKKIYTYVQIVSDTTNYNPRYGVELNKNRGGNYGQVEDTVNNNTSMALTLKTKIGLNPEIFNNDMYKFGPFDKIYEPDYSESKYTDIVKSAEFDQIIKKITNSSPMMFAFYGTSGSGKTKVLKQVVLGLCNKLGLQYSDLEIGFKEIFRIHDTGEIYNGNIQNFNLSFQNGTFKITSDTTIDLYHSIKLGQKKTFKKNEVFDKLLNYFLDENRLTKAILSNHHSSRSHVLCFFKMKGTGKPDCNFIFADLAGNEKKYDCSTENTLNKFKSIKNNNKLPFYQNEFDSTGNMFDSYKGGETLKSKMNTVIEGQESRFYKMLIEKACNHRVVEGEFINDSLKEFRTELEYMVDVKNKENEYYVPDIYTNKIDQKGLKTCLQDFCFGKVNCFQTKNIVDIVEPESIILKSVYDYLKLSSAQEFYDKLEVCVFGALNITFKDKEPPTIYIDINQVKSIIAGKDEFTFNNNPEVFKTFKDKLKTTKSHANAINSIHSNFPEIYISTLLDMCYQMIDKPNKDSLTLAEIEILKKVFDAIDDENAKTAIGTLEFMNRISKFNTVNSVCFKNNDDTNYEPLKSP